MKLVNIKDNQYKKIQHKRNLHNMNQNIKNRPKKRFNIQTNQHEKD